MASVKMDRKQLKMKLVDILNNAPILQKSEMDIIENGVGRYLTNMLLAGF